MAHAKILVVDDEMVVCRSCELLLAEEGHQVELSQSSQTGLTRAEQHSYDLILLDLKMPELGGMEFLRRIKLVRPDTEVIVMTGYAVIATAVEAMRLGAFDYIPKPFTPAQLIMSVSKALEKRELIAENRYLRRELQSKYRLETIVGNSPAIGAIHELIRQVSGTGATVLIRGESGTGKELVARAIHFNSPRQQKRFVAIDCGALHENLLESELFGHAKGAFTGAVTAKKGLFEVADGGTLFLDEIGHTSLTLQAKLLRVLQERAFTPVGDTSQRTTNMRLIAATNKDLEAMVSHGAFREELFYRLNIFPIRLPPLRDRKEDIPALARHFIAKFCEEMGTGNCGIDPDALQKLTDYDWPGNVRELENVIYRALVIHPNAPLTSEYLPTELRSRAGSLTVNVPKTSHELKRLKRQLRVRAVEDVERRFVKEALQRNDGNVSRAAADVHMQRSNFQALMRRYRIPARSGPRESPESQEPPAGLDQEPAP